MILTRRQLIRRDYQYQITRDALTTNSLVCLPTGLGKTLIAAVVMYNYYRWFPHGKVVFLAPTRPLVDQQKAACRDICGIPTEETCTLMGSTKKDEHGTRRTFWETKRVFFCTPQTMENDIASCVCPAEKVVCLVIDEAHRAKGKQAYCGVVRMLWDRNVSFRLLALTATPGHGIDDVQQVVKNLNIGRIDFRSAGFRVSPLILSLTQSLVYIWSNGPFIDPFIGPLLHSFTRSLADSLVFHSRARLKRRRMTVSGAWTTLALG